MEGPVEGSAAGFMTDLVEGFVVDCREVFVGELVEGFAEEGPFEGFV